MSKKYEILASVVSPGFYEGEIHDATDFESPERILDLLNMKAIKVYKKKVTRNVEDDVDFAAFGQETPNEEAEDVEEEEDSEADDETPEEEESEAEEESEDAEPATDSLAVIEAKRAARRATPRSRRKNTNQRPSNQ